MVPSILPPVIKTDYKPNRRQHIISHYKQPNTTSRLRMALSMPPTVQWPAKKVRDTFLDFFKNKGHSFGTYYAPLLRPAISDQRL